MTTITLGSSSLVGSRLAYGCWRLAGTWDAAQVTPEREAHGQAAVIAAYEAGFTLFDHADIYCDGMAETIFGRVLKEVGGMRERILIASKCGIRKAGEPAGAPYRYDFSAEHILGSCEKTLERLGVERLDLYQLHRPDYLCHPDEVAAAFTQLRDQGKVREFGVSNFLPAQVAMLQKACPMRLIVNQIEFSLAHLAPIEDGTLAQCLAEKMTPLAWSPLAAGRLASGFPPDMRDPHNARKLKLNDALDLIARDRGTDRGTVALAWLLRHPSGVVPIIGTTNPERIQAASQADQLDLTREEWYRLFEAAFGARLP